MPDIKTIKLKCWDDFEIKIKEEYDRLEELRKKEVLHISELLFRGHEIQGWKL